MKIKTKSTAILFAVVFLLSFCSKQKGNGSMNVNKSFPTAEEAAEKGRNDLILAMEAKKDLNVGIDLSKLKESKQSKPLRHSEINFEKILSSDKVSSFDDIVASEKSTIVPFVSGPEVIGIVEVAKFSDGWKVTGLANMPIRDDLNQSGITQKAGATVSVYEIPNLQLLVYGVKEAAGENYYLNFNKFSIKQGSTIKTVYPVIRERALQFNKQFGEQLKKGKLLK